MRDAASSLLRREVVVYKDMPLNQRLERIGELLAKGAYLYAKKQKEKKDKA